jgi:hypothetical protein
MTRTLLVSVSDDRFGRKEGGYKATQDKIHKLFDENPLGIEIRQWTFDLLQHTPFYKLHKVLLNNIDPARNGRAYKPYVICEAFQNIDFGDFVIYNDCSPELWTNINGVDFSRFSLKILHALVEANNDILTSFVRWDKSNPITNNGLGIHTHANFTLERCIKRMGLEDHRYDYQHASGFIAIRKTPETVEFMREWLHWNVIDECACMGWANIPDNYEFWDQEASRKMGHRHDQSISGLLLNKRKADLVEIVSGYNGFNPYNFLQYCKPEAFYEFISSNNKNIPGPDEILKGSRVKNEKGIELLVFEFQPENGIEWIVVGRHESSKYRTTKNTLTLIEQ